MSVISPQSSESHLKKNRPLAQFSRRAPYLPSKQWWHKSPLKSKYTPNLINLFILRVRCAIQPLFRRRGNIWCVTQKVSAWSYICYVRNRLAVLIKDFVFLEWHFSAIMFLDWHFSAIFTLVQCSTYSRLYGALLGPFTLIHTRQHLLSRTIPLY